MGIFSNRVALPIESVRAMDKNAEFEQIPAQG
jgi:hypothetical protein